MMQLFLRILSCLTLFILFSDAAQAHRFAPSLLDIVETTPHNYNIVWKTPSQTSSNVGLLPRWPDGCEVTSESPAIQEGTAIISRWSLNCAGLGGDGLVGHVVAVSGLAENQAAAMVALSLRDGRYYQDVLNADASAFPVPPSPSQLNVMRQYPVLGFEHIWEGLDHLMFVFGLLLLVGGGARLFWTITAFTLGHSVTLSAVTLGAIQYPVPLIEFIIALSIFVLALELARSFQPGFSQRKPSLFRRHPWWLAGGFGLLHGMGFAGALAEIGLPPGNIPLALLFFNIGIELGQIAFVFCILGLWWLVRPHLKVQPERVFIVPVYCLGALSAMWCIERGLGL